LVMKFSTAPVVRPYSAGKVAVWTLNSCRASTEGASSSNDDPFSLRVWLAPSTIISLPKFCPPPTLEIKIPLELTPMFALKGHVYLEEDKSSLVGQPVKLTNLKTNEVKETLTDKDGNYYLPLDANTDYRVSSSRERCAENSFIKTTVGLKKSTTLIADIGFFCEGDVIKIDNIYYDLAKWNIRPDAARELDKLVTIMKKYPKMTIELGSHTDCRATEKYNMDLSQKRAKSAVDYIAKNGVEATRMTAKGYGESMLVNKCECEGTRAVPCTEAEHQQNRRTEFKVLTVK